LDPAKLVDGESLGKGKVFGNWNHIEMALSLEEQGNDTINERPDRVCVVEFQLHAGSWDRV